MSDLISREAAIDAMDTWDKFGCDPNGMLVRYDDGKHYVPYVRYDDMVYVIKSLPSEESKKGKWLPHPGYRDWDVCSACGIGCKRREYGLMPYGEWMTEYSYQYCPNCGAKMEEME